MENLKSGEKNRSHPVGLDESFVSKKEGIEKPAEAAGKPAEGWPSSSKPAEGSGNVGVPKLQPRTRRCGRCGVHIFCVRGPS